MHDPLPYGLIKDFPYAQHIDHSYIEEIVNHWL